MPKKSRFFSILSQISMPPLKSHLIFWPITAGGLAGDLWTKHAVFELLARKTNNTMPLIDGFLSFVYATNPGAAFGIAAGRQTFLTAISIIALIAVLFFFLFGSIKKNIFIATLALLTAGITGNLYDRMFNNGLVRDFIDVVYWPGKHWPAFNVADSMLCIAVAILVFKNFTDRPGQGRAQQQKQEP